ncbi:UvrD-helicase domain-containing protein [Pseudanabaena sp. FACHB-2040]|uniref:UvrD-helicase domain-containing protein n=1 Tax=Pseudanabaena sp. FACHB-2040 TaxID=2692859 RepID=UPI001682E815|nr:UvrD-helicase domain-containing protein [Pseudanabaena sp. FACHB-2040]MBD2261235.1 UvrD-helicase domain-containing protein [Pseudanabaena sp. FACHB-2040]
MVFEIIHKPTFTNQLLAIPKEFVMQILEKIEFLRDDPSPHGSVKKKLHGYKGNIYRLRSGVYRIVYTYGDGWVALLGVDARKDIYKGDKLVAEETELNVSQLPDMADLLTPQPQPTYTAAPAKTEDENLLPTQIDEDLLKRLRVPEECFSILLACRTLDDLTNAKIPDLVRERVFDSVTTPNFDLVLNQPSFLTGSTDDLLRFQEGDLLGFLLKLNPEQEKFITWASEAKGPTLLKGGPGTGKSTVALYRTREILTRLKAEGVESPKILFTTYTNALVTFSKQLLRQLLGEDFHHVEVKTADKRLQALVYRTSGDHTIASSSQLQQSLKVALAEALASLPGNLLQQQAQRLVLERLTPDYLLEEIGTVIESRELKTLEEYQATSRAGRAVPLNRIQRQAVWHLREHLNQQLSAQGLETWEQLRSRALDILRTMENPPLYDAVIVDEAQDLPPNILRFLVQLCKAPNRLFITADANQSIYGSSFRWGNVHSDLKFVGRTGILRVNHRTTQEINEAAHNYLQSGLLEEEPIEWQYIHSGPPPAVRAVADTADEGRLLVQFCRAAAREFRLGIGACAVLTPSERSGRDLAGQLSYLGLEATFMSSGELDLSKPCIKVLTLKAAKGLEFPIVAIAGFIGSRFPYMPKGTPEEAAQEILNRERRTLFVGMTRAMRALLVVVPEQKAPVLLQGFDKSLWNLGSSAA